MDIVTQHQQFVADLIQCEPLGERARELRAMVRRLELIDPSLEQKRIAAMRKARIAQLTRGYVLGS